MTWPLGSSSRRLLRHLFLSYTSMSDGRTPICKATMPNALQRLHSIHPTFPVFPLAIPFFRLSFPPPCHFSLYLLGDAYFSPFGHFSSFIFSFLFWKEPLLISSHPVALSLFKAPTFREDEAFGALSGIFRAKGPSSLPPSIPPHSILQQATYVNFQLAEHFCHPPPAFLEPPFSFLLLPSSLASLAPSHQCFVCIFMVR